MAFYNQNGSCYRYHSNHARRSDGYNCCPPNHPHHRQQHNSGHNQDERKQPKRVSTMDRWRTTHMFPVEVKVYLKDDKVTDVEFVVGPEDNTRTFRAHRLILAAKSTVFEAMLYGPLAEKDQIKIPDVDVDSFSLMLRYFYTDYTSIDNLEFAINTLHTATKYEVLPLREKCVEYIKKSLSPENVCLIYKVAVTMDIEDLIKSCEVIFLDFTKDVLESEQFKSASVDVVKYILSNSILAVPSESYLLKSVLEWGQEECSRIEDVDLRTVVDPLLQQIRFLFMSEEELVKISDTYGVPSSEEVGSIIPFLAKPDRSTGALPAVVNQEIERLELTLFCEEDVYSDCCAFLTENFTYANVTGREFSFTTEVTNIPKHIGGFLIFYKSVKTNLNVDVVTCISIPGRYQRIKFFTRLPIRKTEWFVFIAFPRGVYLHVGDFASVDICISDTSGGLEVRTCSEQEILIEEYGLRLFCETRTSSPKTFLYSYLVSWDAT